MQFIDRLERELREAARREEAARPTVRALRAAKAAGRPMLPLPVAGLVALAVIVSVVVPLAGDRTPEEAARPVSQGVYGTYLARSGGDVVRVVLVPGGYLLDGESIYMNGVLEVDGLRLTLRRPSGNRLPAEVGGEHKSTAGLPPSLTPLQRRDCVLARPATYRWTGSRSTLRLAVVRDGCLARRDLLTAAPLERQER